MKAKFDSNGNNTSDRLPYDARTQEIRVTDQWLIIQCRDSRELRVPISWFPRLMDASTIERRQWELSADGWSVHWPAVDEDIEIDHLFWIDNSHAAIPHV